jgi:hypothetical protein
MTRLDWDNEIEEEILMVGVTGIGNMKVSKWRMEIAEGV